MGCFLGCFGFTKKRKRPKFCNTIVSSNQKHARYIPLDPPDDLSDNELDIKHKSKISSNYEQIDKGKEASIVKIKKKVRFNLNVKTYEPIQNDEIDPYFSEGEEETKWEFNAEETQRATTMFDNRGEQDTMLSRNLSLSYPADYRYRNCSDGYDDEDEIVLDDFDDEDEIYDSDSNEEEEEEDQTINDLMLSQPCSVLKPIENLSQWKEVKARAKLQLKHQQENNMFEQENGLSSDAKKNLYHVSRNDRENENAINSSLSNWMFSSDKDPVAKI